MESIRVVNGKREQDESCREGMYACLLCLLNKEISLTGSSVLITFFENPNTSSSANTATNYLVNLKQKHTIWLCAFSSSHFSLTFIEGYWHCMIQFDELTRIKRSNPQPPPPMIKHKKSLFHFPLDPDNKSIIHFNKLHKLQDSSPALFSNAVPTNSDTSLKLKYHKNNVPHTIIFIYINWTPGFLKPHSSGCCVTSEAQCFIRFSTVT